MTENNDLTAIPPFIAGFTTGIALLAVLIVGFLLIFGTTAQAGYIDSSYNISISEPDDDKFITRVQGYVNWRIRYNDSTTTWDVLEPNASWQTRTGDCSERALLMVAMLQPRVDARVVWGRMPSGILHDSVQVVRNGTVIWKMDPELDVMGVGMHPRERVVTVPQHERGE